MRLFDLVEEHHAIGTAAHLLGELAALVVADVAGRRAKEAADGVWLPVFAHVDAQQRVVVVEEEAGQRLRQFGLADARRPQEEERADRPPRILQAAAGAADGVAHGLDGLLLPDDALAQDILHVEQLLGFGLQHVADRDARPCADDGGNVARIDDFVEIGFNAPAGHQFVVILFEADTVGLVAGGVFVIARFPGFFFLRLEFVQLDLHLLDARRHREHGDAQLGGGFVHQVDGLVGQAAVGDVAMAELDRLHQRLVLVADLVVIFVAAAQPAQDVDAVVNVWLIDIDRGKASLQRRVAFDVLAIFVQRGGADALQLAARQRRLEHVAGVHGAGGIARADHRVQLVDEEDDLALAALNLLDAGFEALLELAAETGAGHQRAQVERDDALAIADCRAHLW